ncbi:arylamine N-acetyltransferase family protein [Cupriavidus agavae]|uniref:N-hydroxyarylamine O-acetyltransferase n=1 Tax=Cupriavidus agavae TaxID=1001822 RepID=A0A4Q7RHE8_9BURK|nr:arylamine N-acetyltransferase [Cupriavidus agavae]RZT31322.1 N-hydroxyarylamine O-acetyltransferase [Cupriavidus agavae]
MHAVDDIPALPPDQRDAWLRRIGFEQPPLPTGESLDALIGAHLIHLPFENLNALTGRRVAIDLPAVFDKLVRHGRGGYCFELNTLFCAGLKALGYRVTPLAARVRWNVPAQTPAGLSHMLLRVEVAHESHIADVGFGGPTPGCALPLSAPAAGNTPYRLLPLPPAESGTSFHQYELAVEDNTDAAAEPWRVLYRFDLTPQPQIDYVARNWYVSTHPDSHFTHGLIAARTAEDGTRLALANAELSRRTPDGQVRREVLTSASAVIEALAAQFGIRIDPDLRAALAARLPQVIPGLSAH